MSTCIQTLSDSELHHWIAMEGQRAWWWWCLFVAPKLTENDHSTKKSLWSLCCPTAPEKTNVLLYSLGWKMSNVMACGNMKPRIRWRAILLFVSVLDKCDHFYKCYLRFHLFFFIIVALLSSLMSDSATTDALRHRHCPTEIAGPWGFIRSCLEEHDVESDTRWE